MPIAPAVGWFNDCHGGEFAFYPQGGDGPAATIPARANTGIILDTDSVFHGVDPVESDSPLPAMRPRMQLRWDYGRWLVHEGEAVGARYRRGEVRFSMSWKAHCFSELEWQRAWGE